MKERVLNALGLMSLSEHNRILDRVSEEHFRSWEKLALECDDLAEQLKNAIAIRAEVEKARDGWMECAKNLEAAK